MKFALPADKRKYLPIVFFMGGFLFDALMLERIDAWHVILQQTLYLLIVTGIFIFEVLEHLGSFTPSENFKKIWKYHDHAAQFFLGTLLNFYTLFYFKSASLGSSYLFLLILIGLLILNEFLHSFEFKIALRCGLLSLALISFFVALVPILLGFGGLGSFVLALAISAGVGALVFYFLQRRLGPQHPFLRHNIKIPYLTVQCVFALAYFFQILPPLPLSLRHIGIYREVHKEGPDYVLTSYRPWWKFWQSGDQTFYAREADKVYCFVSIFSPSRFQEELKVRWSMKGPNGWIDADAIPFEVHGGRGEGFRGFTVKSNYEPGEWLIQIETSDRREVGRIHLEIIRDESSDVRSPRIEKY